MKKLCMVVGVVVMVIALGDGEAAGQGAKGVGASVAAGSAPSERSHSSHSLNPVKWVKKSPKPASDQLQTKGEQDKKLTAKLQAQGLLSANTDLKSACDTFKSTDRCLVALHLSHNVGLDFNCLKSDLTGVQTSADMSGCKGTAGSKPMSLDGAIRALKPEAKAKAEAKNAEKQAHDDLKEVGA